MTAQRSTWPELAKKTIPNQKNIQIPGYMVPLEVNDNKVSEFLLIPVLPGCVHIPPPPPDQTIHVKTRKGKSIEASIRPLWVEGKLKIRNLDKSAASEDSLYEMEMQRSWLLSDSDLEHLPPVPPNTFDCIGRDKDEVVCKAFKDWQPSKVKTPRTE